MRVVLLTHPLFLGSRSQDRFAALLLQGLLAHGHAAELRRPRGWLHGLARRFLPRWPRAHKWIGYLDQYLLFPWVLRWHVWRDPADTLYVFCDQALGPWVPALCHRPHVVHCHDLLALRSALGEVPENPTAWSGRIYQRWIRRGFAHARHFVSDSSHTRDELHRLGQVEPWLSEVVHLGLNHPYGPLDAQQAQDLLAQVDPALPGVPFLLHVGGGQWYKNTQGVLALYVAAVDLAEASGLPVPWLVVVGGGAHVQRARAPGGLLRSLSARARVLDLPLAPVVLLHALYARTEALLFPSLAEGFGWPIAEAMACGSPVLTTGEPPMTEVGADVAVYLPRWSGEAGPQGQAMVRSAWAQSGATLILGLMQRSAARREHDRAAALASARRFDAERALQTYLSLYERILRHATQPGPPL